MGHGIGALREQVAINIDRIAGLLSAVGKCAEHQQEQPLVGLREARRDLTEEMAFIATEADQWILGWPVGQREYVLRYQEALATLQHVAEVVPELAEAHQRQIQEGIPFSDLMLERLGYLFRRQDGLLSGCAEMLRSGKTGRVQELRRAGRELLGLCLQFATEQEDRLTEGLCLPAAAPIFLEILGHMQTLVHHEVKLLDLLAVWIEMSGTQPVGGRHGRHVTGSG